MKRFLLIFGLVFLVSFVPFQPVHAEVTPDINTVIDEDGTVKTKDEVEKEKNVTVKKKIVKKAGIELHSKYYPLENYRANVSDDSGWLSKPAISAMNGITNFFFFLSKIISEMVDTCIDKLYSLDVVNQIADMIANISSKLYQNLFATFGVMFVVIAVLHLFFIFAFKQNATETIKRGLTLFLVLGLVTVWFSNAGYYLKVVNHLTEETEGVLMKAGTAFTADSDEKIPEGQELDGSLAVMRNFYFDLTVERPYLLMNYGTPDKASIIKKDEKRVDSLLSLKSTESAQKQREKIINNEVNKLDNAYMSASSVDYQMAIAFISLLFTIILGIPLILVAFLHVLFSVLPMLLSIVLAITAILSILPSFSNSFFKTFGKMVALFLMKAMVSLFILAIFLIVTLMDKLIPPVNLGLYLVNMLATSLIIICLLIYRNEVISLFSAGEVQMGNTMPKIPRKYKRMLSNMSNMPEWENSYPSNKSQMNAGDLEENPENSNVPVNNEEDNDSIGEIPSYERTQQVPIAEEENSEQVEGKTTEEESQAEVSSTDDEQIEADLEEDGENQDVYYLDDYRDEEKELIERNPQVETMELETEDREIENPNDEMVQPVIDEKERTPQQLESEGEEEINKAEETSISSEDDIEKVADLRSEGDRIENSEVV
ncbi:hypothetical protein HB885_11790 [Listeria seeligeri]|uniref:CD3337/EF1877 family mobilome membrane protein n=1 Tax=Listeria seeligeri TaxID=1640 RepID=UPI001624A574|nr:hypothetical protein [Listeria seeligeri]EIY6893210.1 hypothetical protein [Listeria monocytogenes]MBC1534014.1 hypothetical protein [Listeria seeligeri]MBC1581566.1 hypothetical protein [Listeria seeligeri]MBC1880804.1 hypothetical protein [Listeria seeligeri]MBF2385981.1 hypothetical protein [Listeria seeligeri]